MAKTGQSGSCGLKFTPGLPRRWQRLNITRSLPGSALVGNQSQDPATPDALVWDMGVLSCVCMPVLTHAYFPAQLDAFFLLSKAGMLPVFSFDLHFVFIPQTLSGVPQALIRGCFKKVCEEMKLKDKLTLSHQIFKNPYTAFSSSDVFFLNF